VSDCRATEYRIEGDHYEALIGEAWFAVPADKILQRTDNPTGRAIVCWDAATRDRLLCAGYRILAGGSLQSLLLRVGAARARRGRLDRGALPLGAGAFGLGSGTGSAPSSGTPTGGFPPRARPGEPALRAAGPSAYAVEFVIELAGVGPQILLILIGIKQAREPIQSDNAVDPGRVVDPPEGIGRREIDLFPGDRDQAAPRRAAQKGIIEASLLGDDDWRIRNR